MTVRRSPGRDGERFFIDTKKFTGKPMMAYGQTAITEDLYAARDAAGGQIVDEADNVQLHDADVGAAVRHLCRRTEQTPSDRLRLRRRLRRLSRRQPAIDPGLGAADLRARAIRSAGSASCRRRRRYPDLCYCYHSRGFALASMRSPMLSRYYIQCDLDAKLEDWPDERFWQEFKARCPKEMADAHRHRPVDRKIDRAVAQLRRRADALRPPVPRRRCRPHRAADRGQGAQPRGLGCLLSVARA